jgi:ABC-type multidrug transport system ATPase subunit
MANDGALRVERVAKRYGAGFVIDGVDLVLDRGTAHALLGPNGAGKSTLLRLLARLDDPSRGRVVLEGAEDLDAHRGSVGYLGHELGLYEELTAREQLAFAEALRGAPLPPTVHELLGLRAYLDRPLAACSRGQRQRVALAQALVGTLPVLLLDEPTTGLDAATTTGLADLLRERVAAGAIVVVSTHEPAFAAAIGARVIDVGTLRGAKAPRATA